MKYNAPTMHAASGIVPHGIGRGLTLDEVAVILGPADKPLHRCSVLRLCRVGCKRHGSNAIIKLGFTSLPKGRVFTCEQVQAFMDALQAIDVHADETTAKAMVKHGRVNRPSLPASKRVAGRAAGTGGEVKDDGSVVTLRASYPLSLKLNHTAGAGTPHTRGTIASGPGGAPE